jgi:hypothetical protein
VERGLSRRLQKLSASSLLGAFVSIPHSETMTWQARTAVGTENGNRPKFLLLFGSARSGTSWIGKVFDSHPLTLYKHEPDRVFRDVPMAPRLEDAEKFAPLIRRFFSQLPTFTQTHVAGSLPIFAKQYRSRVASQVHRGTVLSAVATNSSRRFKLPILQCARIDNPELRVVWKSIDSLGRLGLILRVIEECRAILITRHPCACISSTLRGEAQKKFSASVVASEDYGIMKIFLEAAGKKRGLSLDHLRAAHPVERMAWIWVLTNEKASEETKNLAQCLPLHYEDICADPVGKTQELFSFAGLPWAEQTSKFIKASTLGVRPSRFDRLTQGSSRFYGIFRDPVGSANKWKSEMKAEDIERVYQVLRQSDLIHLYPEP